jgi:hypothetical protein
MTAPTTNIFPLRQTTAHEEFIQTVFGHTDGMIWLQALGNGGGGSKGDLATRDMRQVDLFVTRQNTPGNGVYLCVSTILGAARNKEGVGQIVGLWLDIDFKDITDTPEDVLRKLKAARLPPSLVNNSGNGRHAWFLFNEPLAGTAENQQRIEAALKLLADLFGGDQAVTHCAALMRLPGTKNTKHGNCTECETIYSSGQRYELDDLEEWLAETSPVILRKVRQNQFPETNPFLAAAAAAERLGFKPPIDVEKRLNSMGYMAGGESAIHATQLSVSASLLRAGKTTDEVVALLLDATRAAAGDYGKLWNWAREERAIRRMCSDWERKHPVTPERQAEAKAEAAADQIKSRPFLATPYVWTEPQNIPPREWLYGRRLLRKFITATVAPGGVGKSSLEITEALAMVSGHGLLGISSPNRLRVWIWNLEDPREETARRIQATAKRYDLKEADVGDRLFVDCGREQPLVIAETLRTGTVICQPVIDNLVAQIIERQIDVVIIDPFVSCHQVAENDNGAMDMVAKQWGRVAELGNCAVELVQHTRKGEQEVTTESSRGGKALTDACRTVRVVNRMSKEEGNNVGVDNPRLYFRTFNDKANLTPPADLSDWFKLESVDLDNGAINGAGGDSVGVVIRWEWPDPLAGVTGRDFDKAAAVIRAGKWRKDVQAARWVGKAVAQALGLDLDVKADRAKAAALVKFWLNTKALIEVEGDDEKRKPRLFVEVADEN